jgi:hypothetical protein
VKKNAFYRIYKDANIKCKYTHLFFHIVVCTVDVINERFVRTQYVKAKSTGSAVVVVQDGSEEVRLTS